MSVEGLAGCLAPRAVAVIGATNRPRAFGQVAMRNLLDGGFQGPVMPVHPTAEAVAGVLAYPTIEALPTTPDLAIVCLPADRVPETLAALGRRGVAGAVVAALGVDRAAACAAARPFGLRLFGGGSLGLIVPRSRLNAGFAHRPAGAGRLAFVSQSGVPCTAVLDWARPRGIGFSCFVSLGAGWDVDFGDMLDVLANDTETRAILLHIETLTERRAFLPALRAAARNKPVVLVKAGRAEGRARPLGAFLSEALAGPDDVFDAVIQRAGALRVRGLDEIFDAVETLARARAIRGSRLAILANGEGALTLALDDLAQSGLGGADGGGAEATARTADGAPAVAPDPADPTGAATPAPPATVLAWGDGAGGEPARLSPATRERLAALGPVAVGWGEQPDLAVVDLGIAAPGPRHAEALAVLTQAPEIDATLIVHAPTPMADPGEVAQAVIGGPARQGGRVLTCWLGEETAAPARRRLADAGLPTFPTIASALNGFRHLVQYRRNQDMLLETPPAAAADPGPDADRVRVLIARGLADSDGLLDEADTRALLAAYGIPVLPCRRVDTPEAAAAAAGAVGYPVALTLSSPDLPRKWDTGAVALNLETPAAVIAAAGAMTDRVARLRPGARMRGFAVQPMALRPHARQLLAGVACDPVFGPVLVFGEGGRAVEVLRDHRIALPPLNLPLARQAVARTRVAHRLRAQAGRPAADLDAIAQTLVRLSRLLEDNPEVEALDINPLFADEDGVLAVDARVRLAQPDGSARRSWAIRAYPAALAETRCLADGKPVTLRPIRPEDEPAHAALVARVTPQDLRYRFFGAARQLTHDQLARLTQIDYDREMAFIATRPRNATRAPAGDGDDATMGGAAETLGVVRTVTDPDNRRAELAILVRSDLKGTGLGTVLMDKIIRHHRARGTAAIVAQVMADNTAMLRLARKCGFAITPHPEDPEVRDCLLALSP